MGKLVIVFIVAASAVIGFAVYRTLKSAPAVQNSVAAQLENQFRSYISTLPESEQSNIEVETTDAVETFGADLISVNYTFSIALKEKWSIELHDKRVDVTAPPLEVQSRFAASVTPALATKYNTSIQEIAGKERDLMFEKARPLVIAFMTKWLSFQFPKEKNIELKVRFANEPPSPTSAHHEAGQ